MILSLNANEFLRLSMARGATVEVLEGRVWITESGRASDAFVSPGVPYSVGGNGLVVVGTDAAGNQLSRIAVRASFWRLVWDNTALLVKKYTAAARERRTVLQLEGLSDHSLRDIGLKRDEIELIARRLSYL